MSVTPCNSASCLQRTIRTEPGAQLVFIKYANPTPPFYGRKQYPPNPITIYCRCDAVTCLLCNQKNTHTHITQQPTPKTRAQSRRQCVLNFGVHKSPFAFDAEVKCAALWNKLLYTMSMRWMCFVCVCVMIKRK